MEGQQAVRRAQSLYKVLPRAGFTRTTFLELGEAAEVGRPWGMLSQELRVTLFRLVSDYNQELSVIAAEERETVEAFSAKRIGQRERMPIEALPTEDEDEDEIEDETEDPAQVESEESAVTAAQDEGPAKVEPQTDDPFETAVPATVTTEHSGAVTSATSSSST